MSTDNPPLSRPEIRQLLATAYPEFDEFIGFLRACYPKIHAVISTGMNRTAITNVLFEYEAGQPVQLVATIEKHRQTTAKLA